MSKIIRASSSVNLLPFDIQEEILKRVNKVRSLIRFRSISKAWKSLIDSPKFIVDHHSIGDTDQRQLNLLVRYMDDDESGRIHYVSIVDNDGFPYYQDNLTPPPHLSGLYHVNSSVGSSHGLLCYYGYEFGIQELVAVIWNPSIKRSVRIVMPNVAKLLQTHVGFGVCPGTSDPKLVQIITSRHHPSDGDVIMPWQVEVYELSSGVWRSPLCTTLPRKSNSLLLWNDDPVVINGIIYWSGKKSISVEEGWQHLFIPFDLTTEEFEEEIYFPLNPALEVETAYMNLANLRGSLAVSYCHTTLKSEVCDVWVMNHGGAPKSFTKLYSVGMGVPRDNRFSTVREFTKNGDPIMELTSVYRGDQLSRLELYEPRLSGRRFTHLEIRGMYPMSVTSYTETLLLLDHLDSIIHE